MFLICAKDVNNKLRVVEANKLKDTLDIVNDQEEARLIFKEMGINIPSNNAVLARIK